MCEGRRLGPRAKAESYWAVHCFIAVAACIGLAGVGSIPTRAQPKATASSSETVDSSARVVMYALSSAADCKAGKERRIGLWQLDGSKIPLPDAALRRIYGEILARLTKSLPPCLSIVDSSSVGEIISHLLKSGAIDRTGGNEIAALQELHQDVDFLIFPDIYPQDGSYRLTLRAVERRTAKTIRQLAPVAIPQDWWKTTSTDNAVSLDMAIELAVRLFTGASPSFKVLETKGVFFEDTDSQPAAARFIRDRVEAALVQRSSSAIGGGGVRVRGISIADADHTEVGPDRVNEEALAKKDNAAILSGRYWVRKDTLELRLALKVPDGRDLIWQGSVKRTDLAHMNLDPPTLLEHVRKLPKASFSFQTTTPKGTAPTYRVGEELTLMLHASRNVRAYCFFIDSKGDVIPILPTPGRHSKQSPNNAIKAKAIRKLPDPKQNETFRFRITANTLGEELVTCFATTTDVTDKLPRELFPDGPKTIPLLRLGMLREVFRGLTDVEVAESSVTVTIIGD